MRYRYGGIVTETKRVRVAWTGGTPWVIDNEIQKYRFNFLMFFIGMMSIKEDIRAAYAAPKIETTEVRLETGIAQSLPSAGDYEEGGELQPWE